MLKDKLIFGEKRDAYNEIRMWQQSNKTAPIFIWGTGSVAVGVYKNLLKNDLNIDGFFYDFEPAVIDPRLSNQIENVYSLKHLLAKYNRFAVIIGHSRYELAQKLFDLNQVDRVWALTGVIRLGIALDDRFIKENIQKYEYTYSKLSDEKSKINMITYLNAHLTNDSEQILKNFEGTVNFFKNDIFEFNENEVYCDCGAYDGKSAKCFLKTVHYKYRKMFVIEVMKDMYEELISSKVLAENKIHILNVGLSDHVGEDTFQFDSQSTCLSTDGIKVPVTTLDEVVGEEQVTLIKIAIGNSIDKILMGGAKMIRRDLPKMVIMAGVDKRSLLDYIPLLEKIAGIGRYRYFLRYTNATTDCLCLFVIPS